jgi:para-nitrobenzyl esterase
VLVSGSARRAAACPQILGLVACGVAVAIASGLLLAPAAAAANPGPLVVTRAGAVRGLLVGSVKQWRGVPYAASPTGERRWRPPGPVARWLGVREATRFAPPCAQLEAGAVVGSEDCLYLNVFAPGGASKTSRLPVMVHLHPGGNATGRPYESAAAFTKRNVIVVTVAYRLGVFGFVGHPALTAEGAGSSGEYGVFDQLAALRWVHQNIAAFGGDPRRVTLFGSSSGSFDAVALVASPLSRGLIDRAAIQGIALGPLTGGRTIADAEQLGSEVANRVGCGLRPDTPACLRAVPADALVRAAGSLDLSAPVGGVVLPRAPLDLLRNRKTVPLLIGFDREEDAVFFAPFPDPYGAHAWVRDTNALVGPEFGPRARLLYPRAAYRSWLWSYLTLRTDAVRGCPTRRLANAVRSPVWRWLYTHTYEHDPTLGAFRASHLLEEQLIWHADVQHLRHSLTKREIRLSNRLVSYWTNFAKRANPNGPGVPHWPRYRADREPVLRLDDRLTTIRSYHTHQCGFLRTIPILFPAAP